MSIAEIKLEVIDKVLKLKSETTLSEILALLNGADEKELPKLSENYDAIKEQYEEVIQKLSHS